MKADLVDFLTDNEKLFVNSNTGKGKTLDLSVFALIFMDNNPDFNGIANYHLNIYDIITNKPKFEFSKYGLLPFNRLEKGNWLIMIDDFIAVKKDLQNLGSILGTLARKMNVHFWTSIHYYTHLKPDSRKLFQYEIIPNLTKIYKGKLTELSKLKLECYIPDTMDLRYKFKINNVLDLVKGNYECKNVYVKGNLYDTYELVPFSSERKIIHEISTWCKSLDDIEKNVNLLTKNRSHYKYLVNQVRQKVGV